MSSACDKVIAYLHKMESDLRDNIKNQLEAENKSPNNSSIKHVPHFKKKHEMSEEDQNSLGNLLEPDVIIEETKAGDATPIEKSVQKETAIKVNFKIKLNATQVKIRKKRGPKPKIREKNYECHMCQKCFMTNCQLIDHIRTHTGERPYTCNICNKSFTHSSTLAKHSRTHTGIKPFECKFCKKRFAQSGNLASHLRTHTGEKRYKCIICEKNFVNLIRHMRTHTGEKPFECHICKKRFAQSGHLTSHVRETHGGIKVHKCVFCDKAFARSNTLAIHLRLHTGELPYKCNICTKAFKTSTGLRNHKEIHELKNEIALV